MVGWQGPRGGNGALAIYQTTITSSQQVTLTSSLSIGLPVSLFLSTSLLAVQRPVALSLPPPLLSLSNPNRASSSSPSFAIPADPPCLCPSTNPPLALNGGCPRPPVRQTPVYGWQRRWRRRRLRLLWLRQYRRQLVVVLKCMRDGRDNTAGETTDMPRHRPQRPSNMSLYSPSSG